MVKIVAKFRIKEGLEAEYLEKLKPCVQASRQEEGCLEYMPYWNGEERVLTLFECFRDSAAAARHLEYPHYARDFRALKPYYEGKAQAERFEEPLI